jgi:hypothetical protein
MEDKQIKNLIKTIQDWHEIWKKKQKGEVPKSSPAENDELYANYENLLKKLDLNLSIKQEYKYHPSISRKGIDLIVKYGSKILSLIEIKVKKETSQRTPAGNLRKIDENNEFNIYKDTQSNSIILGSLGKLCYFKEFVRDKINNPIQYKWLQQANHGNDGIGQIRGYFYTVLYLNSEELHSNAFAILTNGEYWVIFEYRKPPNKEEIMEIAKEGLRPCFIKHLKERDEKDKLVNGDKIYWCKLPEDWETLKKYFAEKIEEIKSTNPR